MIWERKVSAFLLLFKNLVTCLFLLLRFILYFLLFAAGFLVQEESIDKPEQNDPNAKYIPSQTINIYEGKGYAKLDVVKIGNEAIWNVLQPWIPMIKQIVIDNRDREAFAMLYPNDAPDKEPQLDWIFFRKYSPDSDRNSLTVHHDTNMNTVNIELSDDYVGGGFFYIKPLASNGQIYDHYDGYEWTNSVKRVNNSHIVFPDLHAGDALFYNYTVEHAIAPLESGARVSGCIMKSFVAECCLDSDQTCLHCFLCWLVFNGLLL